MSVCDKDLCKICDINIANHKYPCTNSHKHIKTCKNCIIMCYKNFGKCPYCNEEDMIPLYNSYNTLFQKLNHFSPLNSGCIFVNRYKNVKLGEWRKQYLKWLKKYNYPDSDMKINYICKKNMFPCLTDDEKHVIDKMSSGYKYYTLLDDLYYNLKKFKQIRKNILYKNMTIQDNIINKVTLIRNNKIKKIKRNKKVKNKRRNRYKKSDML